MSIKKDSHIKPPHVRVDMDELRRAVEQEELQEYRELWSMTQFSMQGLIDELKRMRRENKLLQDSLHRYRESLEASYPEIMHEWFESEYFKKLSAYHPTDEEKRNAGRLDELLAKAKELLGKGKAS